MILSDKLPFGFSITSRSLQIKFSIGSSIKLLLQWLILFTPLLPRGISASLFCSMLLLLSLLSFLLLLSSITLLFSPSICLTLSKLLLSFISHVSLLNWGSTLKSIIDSQLLSLKALLHGCLKSSFNVDALFNSSNILIMLSFKSLLFSLKHGPCGLQFWKTDSL